MAITKLGSREEVSPTKTREEGENNKDDDSKKPHCPSEEMGALLCDMFFLLLVSPTSCGSDGYGS